MQTPDPADLKAIFGMQPKDAIRYLEAKGYRLSWDWHEVADAAHARAFTVAKCARLDVLRDIRRALEEALAGGKTLAQFRKELTPVLQAKGWWGKQIIVDSQGGAEVARLGSPRRLKTIYQTNLQSAYMAGRYKQMKEAADTMPYWQWSAILDGRTRPAHRAMHGRVFRHDDGLWGVAFPPAGYNCRCVVRALSEAGLKRKGLTPESSVGRLETREAETGIDKRSGEVRKAPRTGIVLTGQDGKQHFFAPDAGFNASPMASQLLDDVLYAKAQAALPSRGEALAVVRDTLLSPARQAGWRAFVENAHAFGRKQGQTCTLGVLPLKVAEASGASPLLTIADRLVVGKKARRHDTKGDGLAAEDWHGLPGALDQARWFRDEETGNLVGLCADGVAVIANHEGRIDSVYRDAQAARKIETGRWAPVG